MICPLCGQTDEKGEVAPFVCLPHLMDIAMGRERQRPLCLPEGLSEGLSQTDNVLDREKEK